MNGPQDVGGRHGFGPVAPEPDEPPFHAAWERRVLGLTLCCGALGHWTLDASRHARESLPPALYYGSSYYRIWLEALERLLLEHGELTAGELATGVVHAPARAGERRLEAARVPAVLAAGAPSARPAEAPPRFAPGDAVRTVATHVPTHTRLPGYARDKPGVVDAVHGAHVLPDAGAHGLGERPETLYTVRFDGGTLWGDGGEPGLEVRLDLFESYLRPADADAGAEPVDAAPRTAGSAT